MSYEVVPQSPEEFANLHPLIQQIHHRVAELGNQNEPVKDPYNPLRHDAPDHSRSYHRDGRITYGGLWQAHRLEIDDKELVYAYCPPVRFLPDAAMFLLEKVSVDGPLPEKKEGYKPLAADAEFIVNEFDERGLAVRTRFGLIRDTSRVTKSRTTIFGDVTGMGFVELSRDIKPAEERKLDLVIDDPEGHPKLLDGMVSLSLLERRTVHKNQADYHAREREHRERLEDIARAQIMPFFPPGHRFE